MLGIGNTVSILRHYADRDCFQDARFDGIQECRHCFAGQSRTDHHNLTLGRQQISLKFVGVILSGIHQTAAARFLIRQFDRIADAGIARLPLAVHPLKHRNVDIDIIVDADLGFTFVETMQASGVLVQPALPGNRHRQEERIQARFIESFADERTGRNDCKRSIYRRFTDFPQLFSFCLPTQPTRNRHHIRDFLSQQLFQPFHMRHTFRQDNGVPALAVVFDDIRNQFAVTLFILKNLLINLLKGHLLPDCRIERCELHPYFVVERPCLRLLFRIILIADRSALHKDNLLQAIFSSRCGRQTIDVLRRGCLQSLLETDRRQMVALIDDDHTVILEAFVDFTFVVKGLQQSNVYLLGQLFLSASQLPDQLFGFLFVLGIREIEECLDFLLPHTDQTRFVHDNQGVHFLLGDDVQCAHRFTERGRPAENPIIVYKQIGHRFFLFRPQLSFEIHT